MPRSPSNDYELSCHENFEGHQAANRRRVVTCDEALEVWDAGFYYRGNAADQTSEWLVIGETSLGRMVTIGVLWREDYQDWRAVNAWDTKTSDW